MNEHRVPVSFYRIFSICILTALITACTTTRSPYNHTVVDSNRGTVSVSELTVENNSYTAGSFKRGAESLRIEYPDMCWASGIEGTAILYIDIGDDGEPVDVKVTRGIGGSCDEAARRALRNADYDPARNPEGDAIEARHFVSIIFSQ